VLELGASVEHVLLSQMILAAAATASSTRSTKAQTPTSRVTTAARIITFISVLWTANGIWGLIKDIYFAVAGLFTMKADAEATLTWYTHRSHIANDGCTSK
jgi:hypothetical protein